MLLQFLYSFFLMGKSETVKAVECIVNQFFIESALP